jgi:hypothetical protein
MVTPDRGRLEASTIGVCQVLRSWYRAGVLSESDTELAPIEVEIGDGICDSLSNGDNEDLLLEDDELDTSEVDTE